MNVTMKTIHSLAKILQTTAPVKKADSVQNKVPVKRDEVTLSPEAARMQALQRRMAEVPEIREEAVATIRKAIDEGTYNVPADKIAEKMLEYLKSIK
jgi:negative regulator of flagellin synthesis FlgM